MIIAIIKYIVIGPIFYGYVPNIPVIIILIIVTKSPPTPVPRVYRATQFFDKKLIRTKNPS
jgi:hypothetical protein